MARRSAKQDPGVEHDPMTPKRTRLSAAWIAAIVALIFLVLLIVFIAQNNRSVKVSYFGATGHVSEALALLVAAVAGAVVTVLIGTGRILQLRIQTRRQGKAIKKQRNAAYPQTPPSTASSASPAAPARETQAVDTERQT